MKVSGIGEVYKGDSLLGNVDYELEGVGRSGRHGILSGRKDLELRLIDGPSVRS
jgi:hypothetical protein